MLQAIIHIPSNQIDDFTAYFYTLGCTGIEINDAATFTESFGDHYGELYHLNETDYPEIGAILTAYFDRSDQENLTAELLHVVETNGIELLAELVIAPLPEVNYEELWKSHHEPIEIPPFTILPPWIDDNRYSESIVLKMEPGMGFGTGSHETTRFCINGLIAFVEAEDVVIDFGCGSGILAIVAKHLTNNSVYGIEIDPTALEIAKQQAKMNQVDITFSKDLSNVPMANVLVANLVFSIFEDQLSIIKQHIKPTGIGLFSGLLKSEKQLFFNLLHNHQLEPFELWEGNTFMMVAVRVKDE